jgi:hypothetical protein
MVGSKGADFEPHFAEFGDTGRLARILSTIEESEYEILWPPHVDSCQSPNRHQNLRFTYFDGGFVVQPRVPTPLTDDWVVGLELKGYGKPDAYHAIMANAQWAVKGKTAEATFTGLVVQYANDREGLRQNFIVTEALPRGPLRLDVQAHLVGLAMAVADGGDYVAFFNALVRVVRYSDLHVWDSRGQVLAARFVAISEDSFALVVEDGDAAYPIVIDPLTHRWVGTGDQTGSRYGFSVAYGKFKGGSDVGDIVVGAPYYDSGQPDEGKVFVYNGDDLGISSTPTWTGESNDDYSHFGYSVAAGDFNGDGADDLLVGAPDYGSYTEGRAFIWWGDSTAFLGPNGTPGNADWQYGADDMEAKLGWSVASAGDVNNDGKEDVIIGAPYYNIYNTGKAFLFHGPPASSPNWTATISDQNALFGSSVSSAGDVNGDGFHDVIIGAPEFDGGQTDEGAAFIWHGSSSGLTPNPGTQSNAARRLEKDQASAKFGYSVAAAGDVNGDGYWDVIVGHPISTTQSRTRERPLFIMEAAVAFRLLQAGRRRAIRRAPASGSVCSQEMTSGKTATGRSLWERPTMIPRQQRMAAARFSGTAGLAAWATLGPRRTLTGVRATCEASLTPVGVSPAVTICGTFSTAGSS